MSLSDTSQRIESPQWTRDQVVGGPFEHTLAHDGYWTPRPPPININQRFAHVWVGSARRAEYTDLGRPLHFISAKTIHIAFTTLCLHAYSSLATPENVGCNDVNCRQLNVCSFSWQGIYYQNAIRVQQSCRVTKHSRSAVSFESVQIVYCSCLYRCANLGQ